MYYISENKRELELYNQLVTQGENYDGISTTQWAEILEHKDGGLFAILKHNKYAASLQYLDNLEGWFNPEI